MCNCKGWDIAYYPEEVTVEQHFCRLIDDCGHSDNTLEEAADEVASAYLREHAWYTSMQEEYGQDYNQEHADTLLEKAVAWQNRTHPSYLFYATNEVDIYENNDIV
jgi:hypothetical protein